ncbi:matrixin family metalloprotease [Streptococcus macedonicus]|uniref:Matrixin family metalloprotease n=1 Tax=Streptococcus macedonicus TaxID=59310 RepID=A0AA47INK1_STRMC|nr:matrixin family metalloprotease [Streptococcus macedonicus]MBF6976125.1 matrixin family metalloprotease [Streptococcus macedonicus]MCW8485463.1 matrixin family metalloprotease [Streptococcus macedonicus]MCW8493684.1 matrixin family metalloprotease [Streptococcus macedonicus]MCW8498876.1 matrixin family metalloprotease [Streptococcus macedonicus]MCW8501057.1 matrixin family metalloprotease [Streptococcus macedonicus]
MKNLFRIIFFIPRLIISIIWNVFWAIFRTIVIIGIVCFGLLYYANNSSSQLANTISTIANNVTSYFSANSDDIANSLKDLSTDDFTYYSGARWSSNSANVYIETTNETLIEAYEEAINAWNATGVFTFNLVSDESSADIIATDYSDASSKAAGFAETETNALTNRITHVDVKLNTYYLTENDYGYTHDRIVYTAEHELGHAIGLDHDDDEQSVMQSSGSYYGIQDVDIQKVQELYAS